MYVIMGCVNTFSYVEHVFFYVLYQCDIFVYIYMFLSSKLYKYLCICSLKLEYMYIYIHMYPFVNCSFWGQYRVVFHPSIVAMTSTGITIQKGTHKSPQCFPIICWEL